MVCIFLLSSSRFSVCMTLFIGLSPKCKGILGNFIRPGSYHVLPRVELDEETGAEQAIIINDYMAVNSVKKDFHKNDLCWTVDEKDVDELLSNV